MAKATDDEKTTKTLKPTKASLEKEITELNESLTNSQNLGDLVSATRTQQEITEKQSALDAL